MAFKYNFTRQPLSPRETLLNRYRTARMTLLFVVLFTVVSIFMTAFTPEASYFMFSAGVPRFIVLIGGILCGRYNMEGARYTDFGLTEPFPTSVLIVFIVIALVLTLLYVLCWLLSAKGKSLGLILAAVFFGIDTVAMIPLFGFVAVILDLVLHIIVFVDLILGITALNKLKTLPPEEPVAQMNVPTDENNNTTTL